MTRPVVHFEIQGRDPKRLRDFYQALFGWQMRDDNPMNYIFIEHGIGGPPEGIGGGIAPSDAPRVLLYVQVLDLHETLRRAQELGGKAVMQPIDVPNGATIAQAEDPEGNRIGLIKQ
ncbi:MAG: VOC family protein [Dehalococcoidia bacterium]|nr:VOC family protein [Dehalococcoidia bacterium]